MRAASLRLASVHLVVLRRRHADLPEWICCAEQSVLYATDVPTKICWDDLSGRIWNMVFKHLRHPLLYSELLSDIEFPTIQWPSILLLNAARSFAAAS
jgi:hypothetical protein